MTGNDDDGVGDLSGARRDALPDALIERIAADAAFVAARRDAPAPSALLMARIERDARRVARTRRRGGWGAVGGLLAAGAAGVAIGLVDPGGVIGAYLPPEPAVEPLAPAYEFQLAELGP